MTQTLPPELISYIVSIMMNLKWAGISFVLFALLGLRWASIPNQPHWRHDLPADLAYWLFLPFFYGYLSHMFTLVGMTLVTGPDSDAVLHTLGHGYAPINALPLWLQVLLILLISDVIQYWLHRAFHSSSLWRFHAVHHSPTIVDWLSAARFHPINQIISFTFIGSVVVCMGFAPLAFLVLMPFNILYSGMVHANLNWTFGPLRYVFASPVFHRWHHTTDPRGVDKNFAPTFPFLDVMFGTFFMPKGEQPVAFGIHANDMPHHFFGQMLYPFRR